MRIALIAAIVAASFSSFSQAATFAVTPQAGLAGAGATVQWGITEYVALSGGYTGLNRAINDVQTSDATYNVDVSLKNPQLFLNWAPFGGHFRVSVGAIAQNSSFKLVGRDFQDPFVESATVNAEFAKSVAPALTIGWETPIQAKGLGYHVSLGAMYAGKPDVSANITCTVALNCSGQQQQDEERKIEDELSKYKVLPILQIGLLYRL